ncbi:hypothetical protein RZS08_34990, partial [Arthrospira platensis SPKY1]|nr:hypothetical protein [Arthrospira platensis SPKY1]
RNYNDVQLLLPMTGPNNGTSFADWSSRARGISVTGAVTSTARKKFAAYEGSGLFNGSNQSLAPNFVLRRNGALFVGAWVYPTKTATWPRVNPVVGMYPGSASVGRFYYGDQNNRAVIWVAGTTTATN